MSTLSAANVDVVTSSAPPVTSAPTTPRTCRIERLTRLGSTTTGGATRKSATSISNTAASDLADSYEAAPVFSIR
jgi:hypothetical protein